MTLGIWRVGGLRRGREGKGERGGDEGGGCVKVICGDL